MSSYYLLTVIAQKRFTRRLKRLCDVVRLRHFNPIDAYAAATELSKHPDVLRVSCSFIQEKTEGVWRDGKHSSE